jgi:hypothetical protein
VDLHGRARGGKNPSCPSTTTTVTETTSPTVFDEDKDKVEDDEGVCVSKVVDMSRGAMVRTTPRRAATSRERAQAEVRR